MKAGPRGPLCISAGDGQFGAVHHPPQHKAGVYAGHALDAGDLVEQQILIGIHVADDDLQLVIGLLTGDQQAFEHFRDAGDAGFQIGETFRRVDIHRDANQRHQRETELAGVEKCAVADDQAGFFQRPYPAQAGRRRQADAVGQILVADPAVLLQNSEDLPVVAV